MFRHALVVGQIFANGRPMTERIRTGRRRGGGCPLNPLNPIGDQTPERPTAGSRVGSVTLSPPAPYSLEYCSHPRHSSDRKPAPCSALHVCLSVCFYLASFCERRDKAADAAPRVKCGHSNTLSAMTLAFFAPAPTNFHAARLAAVSCRGDVGFGCVRLDGLRAAGRAARGAQC